MKNKEDLNRIANILSILRSQDDQMPSQIAHAFIAIAARPGITMQQLSEQIGVSQSSISRAVAALSKVHRLGKPGYDLVEAVEDPGERRRKIVFLTPKGRELARRMLNALEPKEYLDELKLQTAKEWLRTVHQASR